MKDTKINCDAKNCYWNIGGNGKDNCACGQVDIIYGRCQNFITVEEAKRRLKIAETKLEKEKGGEKKC